jgi:hypothetical protein
VYHTAPPTPHRTPPLPQCRRPFLLRLRLNPLHTTAPSCSTSTTTRRRRDLARRDLVPAAAPPASRILREEFVRPCFKKAVCRRADQLGGTFTRFLLRRRGFLCGTAPDLLVLFIPPHTQHQESEVAQIGEEKKKSTTPTSSCQTLSLLSHLSLIFRLKHPAAQHVGSSHSVQGDCPGMRPCFSAGMVFLKMSDRHC